MSVEENKALVRRAIEEIYNKANLEVVDDIYAPDYVLHGNADPEVRDSEGVKQFVRASHAAFTDFSITVEDQIAEGDRVATLWHARINPQSGAAGMHIIAEAVTVTGILIDRIPGGKIQESWAQETWTDENFGLQRIIMLN